MSKYLFVFIFASLLNTHSLFAQNNNLKMSVGTSFNSKNTLGFYNNVRAQNKSNINFDVEYSNRDLSSQLSLNFDDHDKLNFDNSYVNYEKGIAELIVGKVDRIWSFSKKSSLILSSNSRPLEAISISLKNKFNTKWLPSTANWSVELINGSTKNSLNGKNSMLSGARVIISPSEKLNFEFLQIGQWGDQNDKLYSISFDNLLPIETNEGPNKHINKMAGFGLSYSVPLNENTYRYYVQTIGEDEAGNLPSCLSWMAGFELTANKMKFPTIITIEAIDTRVKKSTHGNCGANTMYNNGTYDYVNYDTVLGVPIDTEGTSLGLFVFSQISQKINIEFATKSVSINDNNWSEHRLSSYRQSGLISSLGVSWIKNNIGFKGSIYNQDFNLDKANIKGGYGFGFSSSIIF
ncbi:capsule assembly Wzi family protein [Amylibacter sp.]|nr:capsule assembly Wzi family protein [Amylibacter sp.]